jgi:5-methylcytosine-specific restriction enzyme subunit McrC
VVTDIVLNHPLAGRRIVIDTKFNELLTRGWYRDETLRSGYLYQIYAYIRSQSGRGDKLADQAEGLLLTQRLEKSLTKPSLCKGT